jgi:Domain of unknown function (DUF4362)
VSRRTVLRVLLAGVAVVVVGVFVAWRASGPQPLAEPAQSPSCGFFYNRTPVSRNQRRVTACIVDAAREGRRARAVVAYTTIEGDPIVQYLFVRGPKNVLVIVDSTMDAFGEQKWTRSRCTSLNVFESFVGWTGCARVGHGVGKPSWLEPVKLPG